MTFSDSVQTTHQQSLEQFTGVLERSERMLFHFLRGIVSDDEQARDLVQDSMTHAAEQYRAATRSRQQPDGRMAVALPRRGILGTNLDCGARDRQCGGKAERGADGN